MLVRDYAEYERAHELQRLDDGRYTCRLCRLTWGRKPKTFCAGVPVYRYGAWPENLYTYTQLRRDLKLRPLDREQPDGAYFLRKSPYRRWLYSIDRSVPRRRMVSEKQQEAVVKMRVGLVAKYTCLRCGYYDQSHGKYKYRTRLRDGWCSRCWDEYYRCERQIEHCTWAQKYIQEPFIVLDSETTGLDFKYDEVIEVAMVDGWSGSTLFSSLIQPQDINRWNLATHIHGITRDMLKEAPQFPDVWPAIAAILRRYRRVLVYNASFDHLMLRNTSLRYEYQLPDWHGRHWECLMEQFARYNGAWSEYFHGWRWCTLDEACHHFQVSYDGASHRALADAVRARGVMMAMVDLHGKIELPEAPKPPTDDFFSDGLADLDDHPF